MAKKQNEVLSDGVRKELKDLLDSLQEINQLNAAIQDDVAKNLTETKVTKAAIQRIRKDLMAISKLCKDSRGGAIDLRNAVDAAKK